MSSWPMVLAVAAALGLGAAPFAARADEPAEIARERTAVGDRYVARERACRERFVVTSCVDDARRERREALDRLKERQLALDEERRRERAAGRRQALADKAREDARRDADRDERSERATSKGARAASASSAPAADSKASAVSRAATAPRRPSPGRTRTPSSAKPSEPPSVRAGREASSREAFERRRIAAEVHRRETIDATLTRMAAKPAAASLATSSPATARAASPPR